MVRRLGTLLVLLTVSLLVAPTVQAQVMLQATLDTAQEVPAPTGTNPGEGGTASFTFSDEDKMLMFTVSLHGLTATPIAAHIHQAPPGTAGRSRVVCELCRSRGWRMPVRDGGWQIQGRPLTLTVFSTRGFFYR